MMLVQEIKQKLIDVCDTFCPDNVFLQGTLNPEEEYPDEFITFFVETSELGAFYNDNPFRADLYFAVMFYSTDPTEVATVPQEIAAALKAVGFIPENVGNDVMSDVSTHTGWAMDLIYPYYENQ